MDKFLCSRRLFLYLPHKSLIYVRSLMNCYIFLYRGDYIFTFAITRSGPPTSARLSVRLSTSRWTFLIWGLAADYPFWTSQQFKGFAFTNFLVMILTFLFVHLLFSNNLTNNLDMTFCAISYKLYYLPHQIFYIKSALVKYYILHLYKS